jgi:hypothetical protein
MAKLTKKALKGLVKECLIEILSEGISSETLTESRKPAKRNTSPEREFLSRKKASDNIKFDQNAKAVSKTLTEDPVMQSIFADTAKTTLQEQVAAAKRPAVPAGADRAAQIVSQANPEDLFEGNSNWATLAFADSSPTPK